MQVAVYVPSARSACRAPAAQFRCSRVKPRVRSGVDGTGVRHRRMMLPVLGGFRLIQNHLKHGGNSGDNFAHSAAPTASASAPAGLPARTRSASAGWSWPRRSYCCRAAWASARYTRVAGSLIARSVRLCSRAPPARHASATWPHRIAETAEGMLNAIGLQNRRRARRADHPALARSLQRDASSPMSAARPSRVRGGHPALR